MTRKLAALALVLFCCTVASVRAEVQPGWVFPTVTPEPNALHILGPAGEYFTFLRTCRSTLGHYVIATATIPPGSGPIPHIHHYTDEWFYFPNGGITIMLGEHPYPNTGFIPGLSAPRDMMHFYTSKPGDLFYGPRYIMHGFFNNTTQTQKMVFVWAPDDGVTDYFNSVGQHVGNDPNNLPPIDEKNKELFVSQAPKYGINQSDHFDQYVTGYVWDSQVIERSDPHRAELVKLLTTKFTTPEKTNVPCR